MPPTLSLAQVRLFVFGALAVCLDAFAATSSPLADVRAERLTKEAGHPVQVRIVTTYADAARALKALSPSIESAAPKFNGLSPLEALAQQKRPTAGSLTAPGRPLPVCVIVLPPQADDPVSRGMHARGVAAATVREFVAYHELWHCMENSSPAGIRVPNVPQGPGQGYGPREPGRRMYQEVGADLFALKTLADQGRSVLKISRALQKYRTALNGYEGRCLKAIPASELAEPGPLRTRVTRVQQLRKRLPDCWRSVGPGSGLPPRAAPPLR